MSGVWCLLDLRRMLHRQIFTDMDATESSPVPAFTSGEAGVRNEVHPQTILP